MKRLINIAIHTAAKDKNDYWILKHKEKFKNQVKELYKLYKEIVKENE